MLPLLFLGAALFPPRPRGTESNRAIARGGLFALVAGLIIGIILLVISFLILDGDTFSYDISPAKLAWWMVSFLMMIDGITAPALLRYWPKTADETEQ